MAREPGSKERRDGAETRSRPTQAVKPSSIHTLVIVGQIEGHIILPSQNKTTKYEHVIPQLVALEEDPEVKGLLVILNTVGGDVEAGLALAEMIGSLTKPTASLVLGGGHSIGAPVAVASDYTLIAPTATMTIHPIRMNGLVIGVPQTYEYLDKMQDRVVDFVVRHSHIGEARFRELMLRTGELARDVGTVLVGEDAVRAGLIDGVGGVGQALETLHDMVRAMEAVQGRHRGGTSEPRERPPAAPESRGRERPSATPLIRRARVRTGVL